jgi:hypothetical protein
MTTPALVKEAFYKATAFITREGLSELLNWLENETDFFIAPSSMNFHGNHDNGLIFHSLTVTRFALHNFNFIIKEKPDLEYLRESVLICGLFHDICKTNVYHKQEKWIKDDKGKWKSYSGYAIDDKFPYGHGEKSVLLISKFMKLTDAEAMAIRWHMGQTEPSTTIQNNPQYYAYNEAINHPLVRLIQCADMISISVEEIRDLKNL